MVFRGDECSIETEHAPANFATPRHIAHTPIRKARGQGLAKLEAQNRRLGRQFPRKSLQVSPGLSP